jgi:methionine--tRNA ligase beta chain
VEIFMISYEDFAKLDLRVGTIKEATSVEDSEKLLRLRVDIGGEERQILAGVAKIYAPDQLLGRQIIVIANLTPRTLMGLESQGMLLAADGVNGPVLLQPEQNVPSGAKVI